MCPSVRYDASAQMCANPGLQVARAPTFCTVTPNIFGPSVWNLLHVTLLATGILKWLVDFWEVLHPCLSIVTDGPGLLWAGIAQSVQQLATGCTVRGSNPEGVEIFRTSTDRPWGPHRLLCNGYRVSFPRIERSGRGIDHPSHLVPRSKKEQSYTSTPLMGLHDLFFGGLFRLHQVQAPYQVRSVYKLNPSPSCDDCLLPLMPAV